MALNCALCAVDGTLRSFSFLGLATSIAELKYQNLFLKATETLKNFGEYSSQMLEYKHEICFKTLKLKNNLVHNVLFFNC